MPANLDDIRVWLMRGKFKGATHVIIVCDTFDWEDYPIYVFPGHQIKSCLAEIQADPMEKVMEVYDLSLSVASQLEEEKAWHV